MQIHITRGEDSSGPFTLEQVKDYLAEGILLSDDLAWHEGLDNWVSLGELVAPPAAPLPPEPLPAPPQEVIPEETQPMQTVPPVSPQPARGAPKAKSKKLLVVGIVVGLLVLGGATAAIFILKGKPQENTEAGGGNKLPNNTKSPKDTNNSNPLPPNPNTLIPGLPGVDTNSVPTNPEPTNSIPTTPDANGSEPLLPPVPGTNPEPPSASLAQFIKGKRIYFLPPKDPRAPKDFKMPELFWQFGADGTVQTGTIMVNGKALPLDPPGKYTVDELTLTLTRPTGTPGNAPEDINSHLTFLKAEPDEGDALSLINSKGKKELLTITKVEAAKPLSKPPKKDSFEMMLLAGDKNGDGKFSREEGSFFPAWKTGFDRFDINKDGFVDEAEFEVVKASKPNTGPTTSPPNPEPPLAGAIARLMEQAAKGDAEAQVKLGHAYDYGEGVPKNPAEAMKWYRKAAFQGDDMAQYNMAASLALGEGIPAPDKVSAYAWSHLAASKLELAQDLKEELGKELAPAELAQAKAKVAELQKTIEAQTKEKPEEPEEPETTTPKPLLPPLPGTDPETKTEPANPKAKKPGTVLWEFATGSSVNSSPAIGSDGTVYVGSRDKKLYAIHGKSGGKLWEFETGFWVESIPAIGSDGTVYVGSFDNKLYAINGKSGVKLWEFETGSSVSSSPAIGSDGTV
ncbi:MAG: PQQ-binding-like beta-propeller repeat protein, partial [Verrucomicrobiota bacterium]|nr:PQQ-binding-like beta-propeller repeat protein [Verrucomicrobiota bacterium]